MRLFVTSWAFPGVYANPKRWASLLCISVLAAGAVIILWGVVNKKRTLPASAGSSV